MSLASASWLTNRPEVADALEIWRESVSGARYPVELVESSLKVVREDLRGNRELSDVAAFSAGPLPHED